MPPKKIAGIDAVRDTKNEMTCTRNVTEVFRNANETQVEKVRKPGSETEEIS